MAKSVKKRIFHLWCTSPETDHMELFTKHHTPR